MASITSGPGDERWERALAVVLRSGQVPTNALHVTALLEMSGYNDRRAEAEFGYTDLFEMGEELFDQVSVRLQNRMVTTVPRIPWYKWLGMGFIYYLRGMMFAMPMVVSILAMLLLRYSLWSYAEFGPERATAIALATMGSFLVTGGFTQAIARRGLFYISQREFALARKTSTGLMLVGLVLAVLAGAAIVGLNLVVPFFPWRLISSAAPYYLFLVLLWLTITILYMLRQELLFTTTTVGGIIIVWYLYGYKQWFAIETAQMIGLGLSILVSLVLAFWLLHRYEREDVSEGDPRLPRWSQVTWGLVPYFCFGVLYYGFLFLDRLLAWSVPGQIHPFPIWFLGDYELGLDWAILTLVLPLGFLELFINLFAKRLEAQTAMTPAAEWKRFNREFQRNYIIQFILLSVLSTFGAWLVWLVLGPYNAFGMLNVALFNNKVTQLVFVLGTVSYVLISLGLLNCLMMFCLNDPWPAVRSIAIAILVDLVVGFILSRQISHGFAAAGLLAGALVFALLSAIQIYRQLGQLDYILYRSV